MRRLFRVVPSIAVIALGTVTAHAVEVISGPTLTMDPNFRTPLAGVVSFQTDVAVEVHLTISYGSDIQTVQFPSATQHDLPVLGLKADRTYAVDIELIPGGRAGTVYATTSPLPSDFPTLTTVVSDPRRMEPGYTLIDCMRRSNDDNRPQYTAIVDSEGDVVWYTTHCFAAARQLRNGKLLYRSGSDAVEMDMLANQVRLPLEVPGVGLHHDFLKTPHGTYLSLDRQRVAVTDFPTSETDAGAPTAPTILRDDSVVEFLPDGTLRREWPLVEMLDLTRIGYLSLRETRDGFDWTHSNAVDYRAEDDSIIVSVRHQDAVIKFSRATGELGWILGPHDNWSPEFQQYLLHPSGGDFRWQFHQHAPMWTGSGTLLLFDNGNYRASPFDGTTPKTNAESFSRGVEYDINPKNMRVRQVWAYGEDIPERLYSSFISDADWLERTKNRLLTFGGVSFVDGVATADLGMGSTHARIVEVTRRKRPITVFELWAHDPAGGRIAAYRAERIPSLYPFVDRKAPRRVRGLRMRKADGLAMMSWSAPGVDSEHDTAEHYMVYGSASPTAGFEMLESTAEQEFQTDYEAGKVTFFKIVAANTTGTSGDEPAVSRNSAEPDSGQF